MSSAMNRPCRADAAYMDAIILLVSCDGHVREVARLHRQLGMFCGALLCNANGLGPNLIVVPHIDRSTMMVSLISAASPR